MSNREEFEKRAFIQVAPLVASVVGRRLVGAAAKKIAPNLVRKVGAGLGRAIPGAVRRPAGKIMRSTPVKATSAVAKEGVSYGIANKALGSSGPKPTLTKPSIQQQPSPSPIKPRF